MLEVDPEIAALLSMAAPVTIGSETLQTTRGPRSSMHPLCCLKRWTDGIR